MERKRRVSNERGEGVISLYRLERNIFFHFLRARLNTIRTATDFPAVTVYFVYCNRLL